MPRRPHTPEALAMLHRWSFATGAELVCLESGLINRSYLVMDGDRPRAVLQWLNPAVVPPEVNRDIDVIARCLERHGVASPQVVPTRDGSLWAEDPDGGCWRCLTHVGDRTIERLPSPGEVRSAGALVARFHRALEDLHEPLVCLREGAQDTLRHLTALDRALEVHRDHRLRDHVAGLREEVQRRWESWHGPRDLPPRLIHGDLKISNIRFLGATAHALVDLDTLARSTIDAELGDALRSWCNAAGEDDHESRFDLELFRAAITGYAEGGGLELLGDDEWRSLVPGTERICLNLTARFAADALNECYFGWNPRFGGRGEHCLLRARGQLSLATAVGDARPRAEAIVAAVRGLTPADGP